jgi:hypothetical protein
LLTILFSFCCYCYCYCYSLNFTPTHQLITTTDYRTCTCRNFDHSLKSRNPEWGVRNIEDVIQIANDIGDLELIHQTDMPSNNISLIFRKRKKINK